MFICRFDTDTGISVMISVEYDTACKYIKWIKIFCKKKNLNK